MTEGTQIIPTQPQQRSHVFTLSPEASALSVEIAKCLKLVAPASMAADAQLSWIASALDALEGIRAAEVQAISAELRRSVTRPAQIVPEIARLVSERRARLSRADDPAPAQRRQEFLIATEASDRRAKAKTPEEVDEAWAWERQARKDAGLSVPPLQPPLTRDELEHMPAHLVAMGMRYGFLERRNGQLVEKPRFPTGQE